MKPQMHELLALRHTDVISLVGGRRSFRRLRMIPVFVRGAIHKVSFASSKSNLPGCEARYRLLQCEQCQKGARVLRLWQHQLMCATCCTRAGVKYESQRPYSSPKELIQYMEEQDSIHLPQEK